jgi:hypothetical protein
MTLRKFWISYAVRCLFIAAYAYIGFALGGYPGFFWGAVGAFLGIAVEIVIEWLWRVTA